MNKIQNIFDILSRVFLGVFFLAYGINGFYPFLAYILPPDPPLTGNALSYISGLKDSGFFWPTWKITEIIGGVLLLSNHYIPFAINILFPIVLITFLFHITIYQASIPSTIAMLIAEIYLLYRYRKSFCSLFS